VKVLKLKSSFTDNLFDFVPDGVVIGLGKARRGLVKFVLDLLFVKPPTVGLRMLTREEDLDSIPGVVGADFPSRYDIERP
jgi:hypothetical protein